MPIDVLLYGAARPNLGLHALSFGGRRHRTFSIQQLHPAVNPRVSMPFQQNDATAALTGIITLSFRRISILNTHAIQLIQGWTIVVRRRAFLPVKSDGAPRQPGRHAGQQSSPHAGQQLKRLRKTSGQGNLFNS